MRSSRKVTEDKIRRAQRSMVISERENPSGLECQRDLKRDPTPRKVIRATAGETAPRGLPETVMAE